MRKRNALIYFTIMVTIISGEFISSNLTEYLIIVTILLIFTSILTDIFVSIFIKINITNAFKSILLFCFFLVAGYLILPNQMFYGDDRSKVSSVKANIYTIQHMIEEHAKNHNAKYPTNLTELNNETQIDSFRIIKNPCSNKASDAIIETNVVLIKDDKYVPCSLYIRFEESKYSIYGTDKLGFPIIEKGKLYYRDNQTFLN